MAAEKVTPMVLKVDLQCPDCYRKIKRTLCKIPQIRDQVFDEKKNTVGITVVCCSPEKIRDKLSRRGGKVIKSIDIIDLAKPKEPEKKKEAEKPKEPEKPKQAEKPKEADKPKEAEKPKANGKGDKPKADGPPPAEKPKADGPPPAEKPKETQKAEPPKIPEPAAKPPPAAQAKGPEPVPVNGVPSVLQYCGPSYDYYAAGPYYHGYGFPPPPPQPCYEGYYVHGHGHSHGHGHGYGYGNVNRCDNYFTEENPQACSIM